MWFQPKNDAVLMEAIAAQNENNWTKAAALFQQAGNQYRNHAEKDQLWKAAARARRIDSEE